MGVFQTPRPLAQSLTIPAHLPQSSKEKNRDTYMHGCRQKKERERESWEAGFIFYILVQHKSSISTVQKKKKDLLRDSSLYTRDRTQQTFTPFLPLPHRSLCPSDFLELFSCNAEKLLQKKKKKKNGKEFGCRAGERMGEGRLVAGLLAQRPSLTLTIPRTDARLERPPECRDSFSSTGNQKCQGPPPRALPYTEPGEGRAGRPRSQSPCIYS